MPSLLNVEQSGQFEHTIVVADEGAKVHYIEGCLPEDELISQGDKFVLHLWYAEFIECFLDFIRHVIPVFCFGFPWL